MEKQVKGTTLECVKGDISSQDDVEAVVNAANARLTPGGGVAGVIHRVAGPELYEECKTHAPIETGESVMTEGYNLPNKWVIHALGPVYEETHKSDELLANCYKNALRLADEKGVKSIAFPAISTGAFGYPIDEAAQVSLDAISEVLPDLESVESVRFVLYDDKHLQVYEDNLSKL